MTESTLLPLRMALGLGAIILFEAAVACWIVTSAPGTWLAINGVIPAAIFPQLLCGLSFALAVLTAPLCITPATPNGHVGERALFSGAAQALMLAYLLLVTARLSPLEPEGIVRGALWVGLCSICSILVCNIVPKAFAGLMFLWAVALPMSTYFLIDVFLSTPEGSAGWTANKGVHAATLQTCVHWTLSLSPITGAIGALTGILPDGSEWAGTVPWLFLGAFTLVIGTAPALVRRIKRTA